MGALKLIFLHFVCLFSLLLAYACADDNKNREVLQDKFILSSELLDLSLNPLKVDVGASGNDYEMMVEAHENVTWQVQVKEGEEFIDVEPKEIKTGNGVIKISIPENQTKEEKKAVIVISSMTDYQKEIAFVQEGLSEYASYHFAVIADLHYGITYTGEAPATKITKTLDMIKEKQPNLNALFVCGDLTHSGLADEYQNVTNLIKTNLPASVDVYYMLGNHDKYAGEVSLNAYKTYTGQPYYQYVEKNGYPFITISADPTNERDANFHADAIKFLRNSLSDAARKYVGKPIFVFSHAPSKQTAWGPEWGYNDLHDVLKNYPQVIHFTGHTHYTTEDPRSFWQKDYTWLNVGPGNYGTIAKDVIGSSEIYPKSGNTITEALLVSVDGNMDVTVNRLDTYNKKELKTPWIISAPHDGTRFIYKSEEGMEGIKTRSDKDAVPVMQGKLDVDNVTEYAGDLTFGQGTDDSFIYHYVIEVVDKSTGETVHIRKLFSDYYWRNNGEPQTLSYTISGLKPGTTYKVCVKAVDSFFSESQALNTEFTTKEQIIDPVDALKADLVDVVFTKGGIMNIAEGIGLPIIQSGTVTSLYNNKLHMYVGAFNGLDDKNYYWMDYSNSAVYKDGIEDGFSWEVYCNSSDLEQECQYVMSNDAMLMALNYPWASNGNAPTYCAVMTSKKDTYKYAYNFIKSPELKVDRYYHLLFTWDGAQVKLYRDGKLVFTGDFKIKLPEEAGKQRIGIGSNAGTSWGKLNGNLAFARVYNRILSAEDVAGLYEQITSRTETDVFDSLNTLLTSSELSTELLKEGWRLMNDLSTTKEEVEAFIAKTKL